MTNLLLVDSSQLQMLQEIEGNKSVSLLKLRSKLSWDLEKYANALHGLEQLGLIQRDGLKASCTEAGLKQLQQFKQGKRENIRVAEQTSSYVDEVAAYQLPVNELWMPNLESFLRAIGRNG